METLLLEPSSPAPQHNSSTHTRTPACNNTENAFFASAFPLPPPSPHCRAPSPNEPETLFLVVFFINFGRNLSEPCSFVFESRKNGETEPDEGQANSAINSFGLVAVGVTLPSYLCGGSSVFFRLAFTSFCPPFQLDTRPPLSPGFQSNDIPKGQACNHLFLRCLVLIALSNPGDNFKSAKIPHLGVRRSPKKCCRTVCAV